MENFVVSARKYRPQDFASVVGQSHITTTLKNAIVHNHLAHAFLFCGPRGVGKTTCARILAKTINCENRTAEGEACNACQSCVSFDHGSSLNIHELDAASNNSVDDIRALVEQVRFAPQAGKYKVYIVDEVHMLSAAAFNAFLKTLEEPPAHAIFILATTEKHKILPTILSRCQIFDFKRITNADTVMHLQEICEKENIKAEKKALHLIAQKSEGCMRDSLSILDKIVSFTNGEVTYQNTLEHLNILDEDYYFKMLEAMLAQDFTQTLLLFDEINKKGFEGDMVMNGFAECFRNIMVCKDPRAAELLDVVEGMQVKYLAHAKQFGLSYLISALNVLTDAEIGYKAARNRRLHVELALIKLCYLGQALELTANSQGELVKKKRIDGPIAVKTKEIPTISFKKNGGKNEPNSEAELVIEKPSPPKKEPLPKPMPAMVSQVLEEPKVEFIAEKNIAKTTTAGPKKNLLDSLKERHQLNAQIPEIVEESLPLNQDAIKAILQDFAAEFKEKKSHSVESSLNTTEIQIIDTDTIELISVSIINQRLIEQIKVDLLQALQARFKNQKLQFRFSSAASDAPEQPLDAKYLSSQERFRRIAEQYPLLIELKDKLRLELDY